MRQVPQGAAEERSHGMSWLYTLATAPVWFFLVDLLRSLANG